MAIGFLGRAGGERKNICFKTDLKTFLYFGDSSPERTTIAGKAGSKEVPHTSDLSEFNVRAV